MSIQCMRHPQYDGETSPVLSCKACCSIFIGRIKERGGAPDGPFDTMAYIRVKADAAKADAAKAEVES